MTGVLRGAAAARRRCRATAAARRARCRRCQTNATRATSVATWSSQSRPADEDRSHERHDDGEQQADQGATPPRGGGDRAGLMAADLTDHRVGAPGDPTDEPGAEPSEPSEAGHDQDPDRPDEPGRDRTAHRAGGTGPTRGPDLVLLLSRRGGSRDMDIHGPGSVRHHDVPVVAGLATGQRVHRRREPVDGAVLLDLVVASQPHRDQHARPHQDQPQDDDGAHEPACRGFASIGTER